MTRQWRGFGAIKGKIQMYSYIFIHSFYLSDCDGKVA